MAASILRSIDSASAVIPAVVCVLPDRRALAARFLHDVKSGGIFVPGRPDLTVGQLVSVHLAFARELVAVQTTGIVKWRRLRAAAELPSGIGIAFSETGRGLGALLLHFASTGRGLLPRARRLVVSLATTCRHAGGSFRGKILNLSRSGALIEGDMGLAQGTLIRLHVEPPGHEPLEIPAIVARPDGERRFGARFTLERAPAGLSQKLSTLCAAIERAASES